MFTPTLSFSLSLSFWLCLSVCCSFSLSPSLLSLSLSLSYIYIYTYMYVYMIVLEENGHRDQRLNPEWECVSIHANAIVKRVNQAFLQQLCIKQKSRLGFLTVWSQMWSQTFKEKRKKIKTPGQLTGVSVTCHCINTLIPNIWLVLHKTPTLKTNLLDM